MGTRGLTYENISIDISGMSRMSVADHTKLRIYEEVRGLYTDILRADDTSQKREAVTTLWNLAFNSEVASMIHDDSEAMDGEFVLDKCPLRYAHIIDTHHLK